MDRYQNNQKLQQIFISTKIIRKPVTGIVSGYHALPYILVAPDEDQSSHSIEINGTINVSPKFIISPAQINETYGEIFDPQTFDQDIAGRFFSFAYAQKKNIKIKNEYFSIKNYDEKSDDLIRKLNDQLMMQENIKTGLILSPQFKYYPVSIDRFINEILDREFMN
ncbi:MAG: hypothetical protein JW795_17815 [Chitinivibrionales bacterium]|nr:hypothetical protein [Chitinivibrionales bacterium]